MWRNVSDGQRVAAMHTCSSNCVLGQHGNLKTANQSLNANLGTPSTYCLHRRRAQWAAHRSHPVPPLSGGGGDSKGSGASTIHQLAQVV